MGVTFDEFLEERARAGLLVSLTKGLELEGKAGNKHTNTNTSRRGAFKEPGLEGDLKGRQIVKKTMKSCDCSRIIISLFCADEIN